MTDARIEQLEPSAIAARQEQLARFEREFSYPLGNDRFAIDHGADYLAFFRDLGEPKTFVATVAGAVAGVLVAVRRRLPAPVWYLCDLKVAPAFGALGLGRALLQAFARAHLDRGSRAFGISMDPAVGENRMVRLARRCPSFPVAEGPRLAVFSLDFATWRRVEPVLTRALGPLACYDPRGRKDIVLASSGLPMPLLHLQHGPLARAHLTPPRAGATHMLCLPHQDALVAELAAAGVAAGATASVLHVGMGDFAWRHVLTSDI